MFRLRREHTPVTDASELRHVAARPYSGERLLPAPMLQCINPAPAVSLQKTLVAPGFPEARGTGPQGISMGCVHVSCAWDTLLIAQLPEEAAAFPTPCSQARSRDLPWLAALAQGVISRCCPECLEISTGCEGNFKLTGLSVA